MTNILASQVSTSWYYSMPSSSILGFMALTFLLRAFSALSLKNTQAGEFSASLHLWWLMNTLMVVNEVSTQLNFIILSWGFCKELSVFLNVCVRALSTWSPMRLWFISPRLSFNSLCCLDRTRLDFTLSFHGLDCWCYAC